MLKLYYHPPQNEENIGKKDLEDFIASIKASLGIWSTDFFIMTSSFKKKHTNYCRIDYTV